MTCSALWEFEESQSGRVQVQAVSGGVTVVQMTERSRPSGRHQKNQGTSPTPTTALEYHRHSTTLAHVTAVPCLHIHIHISLSPQLQHLLRSRSGAPHDPDLSLDASPVVHQPPNLTPSKPPPCRHS